VSHYDDMPGCTPPCVPAASDGTNPTCSYGGTYHGWAWSRVDHLHGERHWHWSGDEPWTREEAWQEGSGPEPIVLAQVWLDVFPREGLIDAESVIERAEEIALDNHRLIRSDYDEPDLHYTKEGLAILQSKLDAVWNEWRDEWCESDAAYVGEEEQP
jgi:hypothetical protein